MDKNIKNLMIIAEELETFKLKVYTLFNKEKWLDDFIMSNAPCNYNINTLIRNIHQGTTTHKVKPCENSMFHGIKCLESSDQFGFFKSEADVRPGHAIWITKDEAERLFQLFNKPKVEGFDDNLNKVEK